jgi:Mg2+-importing ATPase
MSVPSASPPRGLEPPAALATRRLADVLDAVRGRSGGLTTEEASARAASLAAPLGDGQVRAIVRELARSIASPLALILLGASAASAVLGERIDAAIIASMVCLSAAINVWQSSRSARAVRALRARVTPTATVRRDGEWRTVARDAVVVGDVVRLSAGDLVPADARLIDTVNLHVQQSALTGESVPAEKRAATEAIDSLSPTAPELVFLGTSVVSGTGTAIVIATGAETMFGDVVGKLAERPEETEFERGSRRFGMLILQTVVFLVGFLVVVSLALGRDAFQSVLFAVSLAVGLTPEYLPMITTVTLAQGALRMAREKVIVKHLPAIQNLGNADVLCSDKTGTLTSGEMALDEALDSEGAPSAAVLRWAQLNSAFEAGVKSALDAAILAAAEPALDGYTKLGEVPFDFERRRLSVVVQHRDAEVTLVTKGAPESVLDRCTGWERDGASTALDPVSRAACAELVRRLYAEGKRVLAVAHRPFARSETLSADAERDLVLAGFLTFADRALPGVEDALAALRRDGVTVKIVSGDSDLVTKVMCGRVGLDASEVRTGEDLDRMDELALRRCVEDVHVFARVSPAQKHRIVLALKHQGHVVAFLGDGINDAPSLHTADVGISVAGAVDVAQEAADILLLEKRLDVLHAGILAGRRSFANVLKYLLMGTSSNFGNMLSMAAAVLFLPFLPMLPTQILVNNFLYDIAQITIPTDRVDPSLVARPQRWNIGSIRRFMLVFGPVSSLFDGATFLVFLFVFGFGESQFQTGWFVESLATQVLVLFVIRTAGRPWARRPSWPLTVTVLLVTSVGIALPYTPLAAPLGMAPLPLSFLLFLAVVVPVYLLAVELLKGRVLRWVLTTPTAKRSPA